MRKTKNKNTFARRLRAARLAAGLTQVHAAERAGISQGDWSNYERSPRPLLATAERLARAVGVGLAELLATENDAGSLSAVSPRKGGCS